MSQTKSMIQEIPVYKLSRGKFQTRRHFDESALKELAASFKEQGIIQPLVVRAYSNDEGYEIVAGERRWRAAQVAGLESVPCLVRNFTDEQMAAVTTIENLQRENLNPIEEAEAFQEMIQSFDYLHEELAYLLGKSRSYITNALRLLKLEPFVQQAIREGALQAGHGKVMASLTKPDQLALANACLKGEWSVRKLEQTIKKQETEPKLKTGIRHQKGPDLERLARQMSESFGTEVKFEVAESDNGGWFKLKFFDPDTLAGLMDKMGIEYES